MKQEKQYWDGIIKNLNPTESSYDGWLDKYNLELLGSRQFIVELGCGWGDDTGHLVKLPARLLSCDFSGEAIEMICKHYPMVDTCQFDMTEGFPFEDGAADVVIADLCLHYFDDSEMGHIMGEVGRVLAPGGRLICRVNSDKDVNHGAGQGEEIQRGLFLKDGVRKRFFDEELIRDCFEGLEIGIGMEIGELREYVLKKYPKEKVVWEFECIKKVDIQLK